MAAKYAVLNRGTEISGLSTRISHSCSKSALPAALITLMALAGCATTTSTDMITVDRAQGSQENIASLSSVISSSPQDPEGYNVRGTAYGRAGEFSRALEDFNRAIQLNPQFYQAYANRALVYRNMGKPVEAANDYNRSLQINPNYDVAYIGRGNIYRQAGRTNEAFNDFNKAIQARDHRWPCLAQSRPDLSAARPARSGDRRFLESHLAVCEFAGAL